MWRNSKLYKNLSNVHGDAEVEIECKRIYEEMEKKCIEKHEILKYFGFDDDEYIGKIIEYNIFCDDKNIIDKIREKSDFDINAGVYLVKNMDIEQLGNWWYVLNKNMSLTLFQNIKYVIPNCIKFLEFGWMYNEESIMPNSVTSVVFGDVYNQRCNLPNSIIDLTFGKCYNQIPNIPNSVKKLKFEQYYCNEILIPDNVEELYFGDEKIEIGIEHKKFKFKNNAI